MCTVLCEGKQLKKFNQTTYIHACIHIATTHTIRNEEKENTHPRETEVRSYTFHSVRVMCKLRVRTSFHFQTYIFVNMQGKKLHELVASRITSRYARENAVS